MREEKKWEKHTGNNHQTRLHKKFEILTTKYFMNKILKRYKIPKNYA